MSDSGKRLNIKETVLSVVAVISCIFAVLSYYQNKKANSIISPPKSEKELSLTLDYYNPLLIKKSDSNKLKIYYNDSEVLNPYLVSFTLENTGKNTIKNKDFIEPITIKINDNVKIKDAYVFNSSNEYLSREVGDNIKFKSNKLIISNFLINSKEKITINMITNNKATNFSVNSRLDGIKDIKFYNSPKDKSDKLKKEIEKQNKKDKTTIYIYTIIILLCILEFLIIIIQKKLKRKKLIDKFNYVDVKVNYNKGNNSQLDTVLEMLNNYYLTLQKKNLSEEEIKSKVNQYYQEYKLTIELLNRFTNLTH